MKGANIKTERHELGRPGPLGLRVVQGKGREAAGPPRAGTRIVPHPKVGAEIGRITKADLSRCWTCGTCDAECPVNQATQALKPRKVLRMASLGLLEELVRLPEIWYCLTCNRCEQICPTLAGPSRLFPFLRSEAVANGVVAWEQVAQYRKLFSRFQRARWHAAALCLEGKMPDVSQPQWEAWLQRPVRLPDTSIEANKTGGSGAGAFRKALSQNQASLCFTCSECTNGCPLRGERSVFDPQWIVRMGNLGLYEELLKSPALWLCITCRRCTEGCSQTVKVHRLIEELRELALKQGIVDAGFFSRWKEASMGLLRQFVREVDGVFSFGVTRSEGQTVT